MASWKFTVAVMLVIASTVFALDCEFNGTTFKDGESSTIAASGPCVEYTCKNGAFAPSKVQCADKDGNCKNPGETFSLVIKDKTYDTCNCTVTADNKVNYSCS